MRVIKDCGFMAVRPQHASTGLEPHFQRVSQRLAEEVERHYRQDDVHSGWVNQPPVAIVGVGEAVVEPDEGGEQRCGDPDLKRRRAATSARSTWRGNGWSAY